MRTSIIARIAILVAPLAIPGPSLAHHSYAMFDDSRKVTVSGTVAKLEWMNPHVYLWVYVPNGDTPGKYDLYAFENGSINVLVRLGWSKTVLQAGEKIAIEYFALKDGGHGGHFIKATLADGRVMQGAGGPGGAPPPHASDGVATPE